MTIEQLINSDAVMLTAKDVSKVLKTDPYNIVLQARQDKENGTNCLGFPVVIVGTRVKIPRIPFLQFLGVLTRER